MAIKTHKEVDSHSSMRTNDLVIELLEKVHIAEANAIDNRLVIEYAMNYANRLISFFKIVSPILSTKENEDVWDLINDVNSKVDELVLSKKLDGKKIMELNRNNQSLHFLLINAVQNHQYLFRIGEREPKGLDTMINLFDSNKLWKKKKKFGVIEKDE